MTSQSSRRVALALLLCTSLLSPGVVSAAPVANSGGQIDPVELGNERAAEASAPREGAASAESPAATKSPGAVEREVEVRKTVDHEGETTQTTVTVEQAINGEPAAAPKVEASEPANPLRPANYDRVFDKAPILNENNHYKPGTGMTLSSENGDFSLATRLRAQMRYEFEADHEERPAQLEHSFSIRRARLQFKGHAFNKHNKFKTELAFSPRDLGMRDGVPHRTPLLTWYFEFDYLRDLTVRMGQYKIPYSRQRVVSSGDLDLVDRSIVNGEFNHDRDIGLDLRSKDLFGLGHKLRYYLGIYMGEGRDIGDRNGTNDFALHYLGRVEVLPMGKFKDYKEADIERNLTPKLSLGATYSFHDDAQRNRGVLGSTLGDGGTTDYHSLTADYAFKWRGFSSTSEFHWRRGFRNAGDAQIDDPANPGMSIPAPVEAARNGWGVFAQLGYMIPRSPVGFAARYSAIRPVGTPDPGDLSAWEGYTSLGRRDGLGGGVSYYIGGHPWKIQADYFRSWEDGVLATGTDLARVQLQLAF